MGATTFREFQAGSDVKDAFSEAVSDARYMSGAGGYSGTLAEKGSYVVITTERRLGPHAADDLARRLIAGGDPRIADKWGPAGAIAVYPSEETTRTVTVKTRLTGDQVNDAYNAVRKATTLRDDETIDGVTITSCTNPKRSRTVSPGSKATYDVVAIADHQVETLGTYPSLGEAKKALTQLSREAQARSLTHYPSGRPTELRVQQSPGTLPTVLVTLTACTVTAEVTIVCETVADTRPDGWLFFGSASC